MIKVILEDAAGNEISMLRLEHGRTLLNRDPKKFSLLSRLSAASYDVFASTDMNELYKELTTLGNDSLEPNEKLELHNVLKLVEACRNNYGSTLTFTPFE